MSHKRIALRLARLARELSQLLEETLSGSPKGRRPIEQAVLESLHGGVSLPARELAKRAGYPYNSRFRDTMAGLARRGLVTRTPDGYALPK